MRYRQAFLFLLGSFSLTQPLFAEACYWGPGTCPEGSYQQDCDNCFAVKKKVYNGTKVSLTCRCPAGGLPQTFPYIKENCSDINFCVPHLVCTQKGKCL